MNLKMQMTLFLVSALTPNLMNLNLLVFECALKPNLMKPTLVHASAAGLMKSSLVLAVALKTSLTNLTTGLGSALGPRQMHPRNRMSAATNYCDRSCKEKRFQCVASRW
mmetsp:Transcript_60509/g.95787  ORF Transcript_60509/g.95787 Transcript_60509/m.95787 type:complete len:109 (-) Transcript_60509:17-343(-)